MGIALALGLVALAAPMSAAGATPVGTTFSPPSNCGSNVTALQLSAPNGQYTVPFAGVITSWSFQAGPSPPTSLRLKVGRPAGGTLFTIVGDSPVQFPAPSTVSTYTEVRIAVEAGDVIGYYAGPADPGVGQCTRSGPPAQIVLVSGDQQPGSTVDFGLPLSGEIDMSALLERDADGDGFGDETQDPCPAEADVPGGACVPPDTTITRGPKPKTKKKVATFEFTASDAGSTFECSLDGKTQFKTCASPFIVQAGKGTHTFEVRATDPGGTVETSPASQTWKVKKKKKRKR